MKAEILAGGLGFRLAKGPYSGSRWRPGIFQAHLPV
jgi:hypothetical protein